MLSWMFGGGKAVPAESVQKTPDVSGSGDQQQDVVALVTAEGAARGKLLKLSDDRPEIDTLAEGAIVHILDNEAEAFQSTFVVYNSAGQVQVSQALDPSMQIQFYKADHSMVWLLPIGDELDGEVATLCFIFDDLVAENSFKYRISIKLFESARKESFLKTVSEQDREWVLGSSAQVDDSAEPEDPMELSSSGETDDESEEDTSVLGTSSKGNRRFSNSVKNSQLALSMGTDRSYIVRGSEIGIFKHGRDGMNHMSTLDEVKGIDGSIFSPSKIMLHDRDRKMLMLRPDQQNTVVELDLETQRVVQEYQAEDATVISDLAPSSKFAQLEGTEIITGLNSNSLFAMDPRLNTSNKKVKGFGYAKSTNPKLSCITATGNGQYALGSNTGQIRLFSDIGKRAKTLLPGLGTPITGIDTSSDGRLLLATHDRYIVLIKTGLDDGRTGFAVSMGKQKPAPIVLKLKPQDVAKYKIKDALFRKATFDMGENKKEEFIVTAIGNLLITWTLKSVLLGRTNDYTIKLYDQAVIADQFRYGYSDIVVTLEDEVKRARLSGKSAKKQ